MDQSTAAAPTWQGEMVAQRDLLNSRVAAARSAGASTDALRAALLETGPGADHLARTAGDPSAFAAMVPVLVDAVGQLVVRRAWHESSADRWAVLGVVPFLPHAMSRSPQVTVDVVVQGAGRVARGADLGAWGRRLSAADAYLPDDDALRAAAAVAAWRSGFVRLRTAALAAAAALPDAALAPLLDLTETDLADHGVASARDVLSRSAADPFWWPGAPETGRVGQVGGFRGSGGPWVGVPVVLGAVDAPTPTWRVAADDQVWVVVADVHGSTVLRETPELAPSTVDVEPLVEGARPDRTLVQSVAPHLGAQDTVTGASPAGPGVVLVSRATSYRLELVRVGPTDDSAAGTPEPSLVEGRR